MDMVPKDDAMKTGLFIRYFLVVFVAISLLLNYSSPFWSSVYIAFIEIFFIFLVTQKKEFTFFYKPKTIEHKVVLLFISFSLLSMTAMICSSSLDDMQVKFSLLRYIFIIIHIAFSCVLIHLYFKSGKIEIINQTLPLTIFLYVLFLLFDYNFNINSLMSDDYLGLPYVTNRRYVGYFVMLSSIISSYYVINKRSDDLKVWCYFLSLLNVSFLIWLGGRGAIISYLISMIIIVLLLNVNSKGIVKNIFILLTIFFISFAVSIPVSVFEWNGAHRFYSGAMEGELLMNSAASTRIFQWAETIELIKAKPLLGYGADAYRFLSTIGFYQPHNFILQITLEFGLLGLISFGVFFLTVVYKSLVNIVCHNKPDGLLVVALVLSIFSHGMLDGTLYHAQPVMLLAIFISFLIKINSLK